MINIEIDAKLITKVKEAKSLGVTIDEHLSWSNHIGELSKKIYSAIGALKRIRPRLERLQLNLKSFKIGRPGRLPVQLRHKRHFPFKSVKLG